ncbi:PGAP1-like protein-domain-containing protein [Dipodascopsis tothii]|uniref:PGAP1-like protein-domain-containing protein n=1 Tax=Dipodascopsis tothii TaxID=44089 RepID=UPI0034CDB578
MAGTSKNTLKGPARLAQHRLLSQHGSFLTIVVTVLSTVFVSCILGAFLTKQTDQRGCQMSYMYPSYARIKSFDSKYTRFASKYSLYLYREQTIDRTVEPDGIPVLFIPGNAGSYKQARAIAAESARQYYDKIRSKGLDEDKGAKNLDFFTADFKEDFTAFHGRTMLDQAEYLNDAISFILSLYETPPPGAPDSYVPPRSVILVGHSMGGIVARTILTLPNYRADSVNTILTLSAPHIVPPATFDWDIVHIYKKINKYWRESYSEKLVGRNPLASVSLISIAGGKLDLIVPSDYTTISSLVPSSNGFTVFTSTMPNVWTSADHLSIVWCDQLRKAIARALLNVVDAREPTKTKNLATRMGVFRDTFLTGLEGHSQQALQLSAVKDTLLKVQDSPGLYLSNDNRRLVLRSFGKTKQPRVHLFPIPKDAAAADDLFSILTGQKLELDGKDQRVDVLLCEGARDKAAFSPGEFNSIIDLSKDDAKALSFACTNAAADTIPLPASTAGAKYPHGGDTFSYLQYRLDDLARYSYVAIVDSFTTPSLGFLTAEIVNQTSYKYEIDMSVPSLLAGGGHVRLPAQRPGFVEISTKALSSSMVSYTLELPSQVCGSQTKLFQPLVRQFITEPHESKYFPNAEKVGVSFHGSAPYVPIIHLNGKTQNTLKFQIWMDPSCGTSQDVYLSVDYFGSLGNVVLRYRSAIAALPLAVAAIVMLIQFNTYDTDGVFMSFGSGLEVFMTKALPILMAVSCVLVIVLSQVTPMSNLPFIEPDDQVVAETLKQKLPLYRQITNNEMFLGLTEWYLCLLAPLFFAVASALCVGVYYATVALLTAVAWTVDRVSQVSVRWPSWRPRRAAPPEPARTEPAAAAPAGSRRLFTSLFLLLSVSLFVPYHFAYVVGFLVHTNTCIRSLRARPGQPPALSANFTNFAFSVLMLMIWVLPVNIPLLVVWIHNLSVRWNTPFSSHHNLLSIMPIILLVERMISGKMIPRVTSRSQIVTKVLLLYIIIYACLHGVLNAYWLHHLLNIFSAWLFVVYLESGKDRTTVGSNLKEYLDRKFDKRP